MAKEKKHVDDSRPVYEAPKVIKMDDTCNSIGQCIPGSGEQNCAVGINAFDNCNNGPGAINSCDDGGGHV